MIFCGPDVWIPISSTIILLFPDYIVILQIKVNVGIGLKMSEEFGTEEIGGWK